MSIEPQSSTLWKNRNYVFLISAQAVSNLGDWLYILALLILIGIHWHASPALVSLMMICNTLPVILMGPFAGVLADRLNRTLLMIVSNLGMAVFIGIIPILPHKWEVFVALFLAGSLEAFFAPAQQGKLKEVVADAHMNQAVSINSAISQTAKIIGPGASGAVVSVLGPSAAFYLDAASFVLSSVCLLFVGIQSEAVTVKPESSAAGDTREGFLHQSAAGFRHIATNRLFLVLTVMMIVVMLILQLSDSQFITLLRLLPHLSPNLFGDLMAASGVGALLSSLFVARIDVRYAVRMMCIGTLMIGIAFGAVAFVVAADLNQWLAVLEGLVGGFGAGLIFVPFQSYAQRHTPSEMTGRVFGVIGSTSNGAALLGPAVGGALMIAVGPVAGFVTTAIGLVAVGLIVFAVYPFMKQRVNDVAESDGGIQETTQA